MDITSLQTYILRIPAILLALTFHEYAHGWVAYRFGDKTAYNAGRLTLNPVVHLDLLGTIFLLFQFFGWAKPVPVDPRNFSRRRAGLVMVSLAGPLSNVLLALLIGSVYQFILVHHISIDPLLGRFFRLAVTINLGISFFNLLPVPPLDGSNIMIGLLPAHAVRRYLEITRHAPTVFIVMLIAEYLLRVPVLSLVLGPLFIPYFTFFKFITGWGFLYL